MKGQSRQQGTEKTPDENAPSTARRRSVPAWNPSDRALEELSERWDALAKEVEGLGWSSLDQDLEGIRERAENLILEARGPLDQQIEQLRELSDTIAKEFETLGRDSLGRTLEGIREQAENLILEARGPLDQQIEQLRELSDTIAKEVEALGRGDIEEVAGELAGLRKRMHHATQLRGLELVKRESAAAKRADRVSRRANAVGAG